MGLSESPQKQTKIVKSTEFKSRAIPLHKRNRNLYLLNTYYIFNTEHVYLMYSTFLNIKKFLSLANNFSTFIDIKENNQDFLFY